MVVNDDAGSLTPRGALWSIASKLAPTGFSAALVGASLNWSTNFGHQLRFHAASFSIATGDR
ncbi:hypothetical protein C1X64_30440 [Pseudomonas sp. GW456-E7]|nr:hypothetical protein C1X64_30440 [Pseudomonas sp. GW456-E7]